MKKGSLLVIVLLAIFVPRVFAAPLPPTTQKKRFSWGENIKQLPQIEALEILLLSASAVEHAQIEWEPGSSSQLRLNDALGNRTLYLNALKELPKLGWSEGAFTFNEKYRKFSFRNQSGPYSYEEGKIKYLEPSQPERSLFSIDLGFRPLMARESGGIFRAWTSFPEPQFYVLNRFGSRGYQVKWSADGQIVDVLPCSTSERRFLLVDNVENGLTRFVFLDTDLNPVAYTIFDLGFEAGKSDVSRVLVRPNSQCEEVFLAGAFGVVKVRYARVFSN